MGTFSELFRNCFGLFSEPLLVLLKVFGTLELFRICFGYVSPLVRHFVGTVSELFRSLFGLLVTCCVCFAFVSELVSDKQSTSNPSEGRTQIGKSCYVKIRHPCSDEKLTESNRNNLIEFARPRSGVSDPKYISFRSIINNQYRRINFMYHVHVAKQL